MSEFKFVQWGKGTPVDYQRLNAMMLNEQYLKDVVDNSARGILAHKNIGATTYNNPSGTYQNITGLENIVFDVEEDRAISLEFQSGRIYSSYSGNAEVRFSLAIDGVQTGDYAGTYVTQYIQFVPSCVFTYIPSEPLSKGTHTVTATFVATGGISYQLVVGQATKTSVIVRDEGKFISASS